MPCLTANINVAEAEVEEDLVGEILARLVDQWSWHDKLLAVNRGDAVQDSGRSCNVEVREKTK